MPLVNLFQSRDTRDIVFVPFASYRKLGGGNVATGASITMREDEFRSAGLQEIVNQISQFYTRVDKIPSELYEAMTESARKKFLSKHKCMNISLPNNLESAKIYVGDELDFWAEIHHSFPDNFADYILDVFAKN